MTDQERYEQVKNMDERLLTERFTPEDENTWLEIVSSCKSNDYGSINVASEKRSTVILKVDKILNAKLAEDLKVERIIVNFDKVLSSYHFGVVRDYIFELKNGTFVEISADIIKQIVEHEQEGRDV